LKSVRIKLAAAQAERDAKAAATAAELAEQARQNLTLAEIWPIYISARKHKWSVGHLQNHMTLTAIGGEPTRRGKGLTVVATDAAGAGGPDRRARSSLA